MGLFHKLLIFCTPFNFMFIPLPEQVESLPRPQFQDSFVWNTKYNWESGPEDPSSLRSGMRRQHKMVADRLGGKHGVGGGGAANDPEGNDNGRNIRGGNSEFRYIPPKNHRQVLAKDFSHQTGEKREETRRMLMKIIEERVPIFENKKKVQELEYLLLEKGLFGVCKWFFPMPPPLDKDEQCTQTELKLLLQRLLPLFDTGEEMNRDKDKSVDVWSEHMD